MWVFWNTDGQLEAVADFFLPPAQLHAAESGITHSLQPNFN